MLIGAMGREKWKKPSVIKLIHVRNGTISHPVDTRMEI